MSAKGEDRMMEGRIGRLASQLICIVLGGGALLLLLRYLFPCILPFLIAWLLSRAVLPFARRLGERIHTSERILAPLFLLLLFLGVILLIGFSAKRLFAELMQFLEGLLQKEEGAFGGLELLLERMKAWGEGLGLYSGKHAEALGALLQEALGGLLQSVSAALPTLAAKILSALPEILLVSVITVISGFYFCIDGDRIFKGICQRLPQRWQTALPKWRSASVRFFKRYLRAYLILFGLTFLGLFLGFSILGVEYAFLVSLLTAVVDLLPVLGVGTVLVPWAAVMLLQERFYLGFGLLILYGVMLILRQILEPRLVGKSLGLHPVLTLFAGYAGWRLFGVVGMILGPPIAMLLRIAIGACARTGEAQDVF